MTTTTKSTAHQIADRFGHDGQNWRDEHGIELDEVCAELARQEWRDGDRTGDTYRYEFEDGSAIVVSGDAWDIEGSTPFSWAGVEEQWGAEYDASDLILCVSPDGWSYHAPGATDEQIAEGDAPPIHAGPGRPTKADREEAFRIWVAR